MSAAGDATAQAMAQVAQARGIPLSTEQISTLQEQAAEVLATFILGAIDKKIQADQSAAVADITTLEAAEKSAGKR